MIRSAPPLLALACAFLLLASGAPGDSRPTLAVEDTMRTELPPQLVRAPRLTLDDILDRVARGEARRDSLIRDEAFTATFRLVRHADDRGKEPEVFAETVLRVFKRPPKAAAIRLREWTLDPDDKDDDGPVVQVRASTDEEIVNFAFRPENRRAYRFRILARDWIGGSRLVYRIAFEPRSALDFEHPSGVVWVDTNEFVIVHQELDYRRSPVPIVLKDIDRMVIERGQVDGIWVLRRVLLRGHFSVPIPKIGRSFDVALRFDDYAINRGIADSVFTAAGAAR